MSKIILAIIESERFPLEVATRAARLADLYDCDLHLVLSDPTVSFLRSSFMISADSQQIAKNVRQAQEEELARLVEGVSKYNLEVSTSIVKDRPASDAIVAFCLEADPFIVVKGTTYHSPAERAVFTFNDWQLIRKLDYPLWLVKKHDKHNTPVIIAAVDPMHPEDRENDLMQAVMAAAKSVAENTGGELLLLHTYEMLEEVNAWAKLEFKPLKVPMEELEQKMQVEHRKALDELAAQHGIDGENVHMLPGRTRDVLPAFAREHDADLVVMGAVARSGLKRRLLGSTAEHVLDHVPCDVLIERSS